MSSPLLVLCADPAGLAAVLTLSAVGVAWSTGWAYDHRVEIHGSWVDGREWLSARRRDAVRVGRRVAQASRAGLLWLLAHVLRAHGEHRGVAR